jgi:hypothetical protein
MATEISVSTPATSPHVPTVAAPAFAGFDTSSYPGDQAMSLWRRLSPYVFVAYYLHAACHPDQSWLGHRAALESMGWNLVPVYVGQQVAGASPCGSTILTEAQGRADGLDCCAKLAAEGFPAGSFAYLDVEHCDTFPQALGDYIAAWVVALAAGGFGPGVYCHEHNAVDVRAAICAGLPTGGSIATPGLTPRFWIAGGYPARFDICKSVPGDSGIAFADLWQSPEPVTRTFGGVSINLDEDCATLQDPGGADGGHA